MADFTTLLSKLGLAKVAPIIFLIILIALLLALGLAGIATEPWPCC